MIASPKYARLLINSVAVLLLSSGVIHAVSANPSTTQVVLKAKQQADLSSQMSGQIALVPISEGDNFAQGDDLVVFDCTVQEAELDQSTSNLAAKQAVHQSNVKMHKAKAVSTVELADSRAKLVHARSDVRIKQHAVEQCRIKAPFAGQLVKRLAYPFETVRQGQVLMEVLDNHNLTIELIVPSKWLSWLKRDVPFSLYVEETGRRYQAHITKILPRVDAVSQSVRVLGKLNEQHGDLISGMSGRADFANQRDLSSNERR